MPRTDLKCDFCGREAPKVRRVALDRGYDRLAARHSIRYACTECSVAKDAGREAATAKVDAPGKPL